MEQETQEIVDMYSETGGPYITSQINARERMMTNEATMEYSLMLCYHGPSTYAIAT